MLEAHVLSPPSKADPFLSASSSMETLFDLLFIYLYNVSQVFAMYHQKALLGERYKNSVGF